MLVTATSSDGRQNIDGSPHSSTSHLHFTAVFREVVKLPAGLVMTGPVASVLQCYLSCTRMDGPNPSGATMQTAWVCSAVLLLRKQPCTRPFRQRILSGVVSMKGRHVREEALPHHVVCPGRLPMPAASCPAVPPTTVTLSLPWPPTGRATAELA